VADKPSEQALTAHSLHPSHSISPIGQQEPDWLAPKSAKPKLG
jgi:hypothetical protein